MTSSDSTRALTITQPAFLIDGSDAEFRSLINQLLYFSARLLSVRDGFGEIIGLTGIQYSILISIRQLSADGEVTVNQLADHLHFSGSFVTVETGKLQKRGLITKKRHLQDRRKIVLSITKEGLKLLDMLTQTQQTINNILFEKLGSNQFVQLRDLVKQLATNADSATLELSHLISKYQIQRNGAQQQGAAKTRAKRSASTQPSA